jgi:NAD(P)-dependent dehydrogenase (short-subunit alcohol dehydrogenase family)
MNCMKGQNWNVVAHCMKEEDCSGNMKNMENVKWVFGDLTQEATIRNIYNCCYENFKRCDCLIFNCMMMDNMYMEMEKMDMMMMKKCMDMNVVACMMMAKTCMKMLKDSNGKMICVTPDCKDMKDSSLACCCKASCEMMMRCMAKECPQITCMTFDMGEKDMRPQMMNMMGMDKGMGMGMGKEKEMGMGMGMDKGMGKEKMMKMDTMMCCQNMTNMMMKAPKDWSGMSFRHNDDRLVSVK